ncbi:hypothetical protein [Halococcus agarilyticus]|uniref:hypothetical protein n=1 Tax=Halococcus agarilyticus TaxID=1232219 RepID=UPI0006778015|nr:hypothetical protein [Halococcus agarilyticus]
MIGATAFCPKTGAQLSERRHYDERGRSLRAPVADGIVDGDELDGELTAGAVRSSRRALLAHFRRSHQRHGSADADLYRTVALWLRRLKRAASGPHEPDTIVWLALSARVREAEHDADWMLAHVAIRCPRCHGRLSYERLGSETIHAACGTDCTDDSADRLAEIETLARDLYARAFPSSEEARFPRSWPETAAAGD